MDSPAQKATKLDANALSTGSAIPVPQPQEKTSTSKIQLHEVQLKDGNQAENAEDTAGPVYLKDQTTTATEIAAMDHWLSESKTEGHWHLINADVSSGAHWAAGQDNLNATEDNWSLEVENGSVKGY